MFVAKLFILFFFLISDHLFLFVVVVIIIVNPYCFNYLPPIIGHRRF